MHSGTPSPDLNILESLNQRITALEHQLLTVSMQKAALVQRVHSLEQFVGSLQMPDGMRLTFEALLSSPVRSPSFSNAVLATDHS